MYANNTKLGNDYLKTKLYTITSENKRDVSQSGNDRTMQVKK